MAGTGEKEDLVLRGFDGKDGAVSYNIVGEITDGPGIHDSAVGPLRLLLFGVSG